MAVWTGAEEPGLLRWLREQAGVVRRFGSICTGAFVLAQAGLVARGLVLYLRRFAGQSQFSTALAFQKSSRIPVRELPMWILEHLPDDLSMEWLADRAAMSVRNFSRAFNGEHGVTPARFVERLRVETAERLMRDSEKSVKAIAAACGFRSPDTLRRALKRGEKPIPTQLRDQAIPISVQH
jgi:transcriptional regulator GlxA family with amidase domain